MEIIRSRDGEIGCVLTIFGIGGVFHLWGAIKHTCLARRLLVHMGGGVTSDHTEEPSSVNNHGGLETVPQFQSCSMTNAPIVSACSLSGDDVERQEGRLTIGTIAVGSPNQSLPILSPGVVDIHVKESLLSVEGYGADTVGVHALGGSSGVGIVSTLLVLSMSPIPRCMLPR
jgi:hypothetical protein